MNPVTLSMTINAQLDIIKPKPKSDSLGKGKGQTMQLQEPAEKFTELFRVDLSRSVLQLKAFFFFKALP